MRAISLWQPWASLWLTDAKIHETRHWPTSYRGWLAVHAAKRRIDDFDGERLDEICDGIWGHHWGLDLPRGAIVGAVRLVGCVPTDTMPIGHRDTDDFECGDFAVGRYAWQKANAVTFPAPIPYRGQQGFFEVADELLPLDLLSAQKQTEGK